MERISRSDADGFRTRSVNAPEEPRGAPATRPSNSLATSSLIASELPQDRAETMDEIERILDGQQPIAFIVRSSFPARRTEFITPDSFTQQVGFIAYPKGHQIPPHVHRPLRRELTATSEVLLVRSGRVKIDLFSQERKLLATRTLEQGDLILLISGGHGFEVLDDAVMIEVKQGPYVGVDEKERFTP